MAKTLSNYNPTVNIGGGITPAGGEFPVAESHDILVDSTGKRLDTKLSEIDAQIGGTGETSVATQLGQKVAKSDITTSAPASTNTDAQVPSTKSMYTALATKPTGTLSTAKPVSGSTDTEIPTSKAVYTGLAEKVNNADITTSAPASTNTDAQVPSTKSMYTALATKPTGTLSTAEPTSSSTDTQIPTAKAVYTGLNKKINTADIASTVAATGSTSATKVPSETAVREAIEAKTIPLESSVPAAGDSPSATAAPSVAATRTAIDAAIDDASQDFEDAAAALQTSYSTFTSEIDAKIGDPTDAADDGATAVWPRLKNAETDIDALSGQFLITDALTTAKMADNTRFYIYTGKEIHVVNATTDITDTTGNIIYKYIGATSGNYTQNNLYQYNTSTSAYVAVTAANALNITVEGSSTAGTIYRPNYWFYYDTNTWKQGSNVSSVTVDSTLSIAGAAADAKATGDAITELSNDFQLNQESLTSLSNTVSNLNIEYYEKNIIYEEITDGYEPYYIYQTYNTNVDNLYGVELRKIYSENLASYKCIEIPVSQGEIYKINRGYILSNCRAYYLMSEQCENINSQIIESYPQYPEKGTSSAQLFDGEVIIPSNVKYLYVNVNINYAYGVFIKKIINDNFVMQNILKEKINKIEELDNAIMKDDIVYTQESTNIYNGKYFNKYLINNSAKNGNERFITAYDLSFIVGPQEVEEGKTYTIYHNKYQTASIAFADENKDPVCAMKVDGSAYGGEVNWWPEINGLVEYISGSYSSLTFKILENSGIKYAYWYLTKNNTLYIGTHTDEDVSDYLNNIQVNEANYILPYEPPVINSGNTTSQAISNLFSEIKDLKNKNADITQINNWKVVVIKNGSTVYFRSHFTDTLDIILETDMAGSSYHGFNFTIWSTISNDSPITVTSGNQFKIARDDICPAHFNNSYRCGNHGDDNGILITAANHGLTESDIGTTFTSSNNQEVTIVYIQDENVFLGAILDPNYSVAGDIALLDNAKITSPLTNGTKTIEFQSYNNAQQIKPADNFVSVKLLIDGQEITKDGIYYSNNYAEIAESYNNIDVYTMVQYLRNNAGNNTNESYYSDNILDNYCTVYNTYRFQERGTVVEIQSIDFHEDINRFSQYGAIQSIAIGNYISLPFTNRKLLSLHDGSSSLELIPSMWDDNTKPPTSYYQFTNSDMTSGIVIGFNPEYADGKDSIRVQNLSGSSAGFIYTSKKMYPRLLGSMMKPRNGDVYECITYRCPLSSQYDSDGAIAWYSFNNIIYYLINIQKTIDKYFTVPDNFIGMKIEVYNTDGNINIINEFVQPKGIRISVTNYGYAELKLTK